MLEELQFCPNSPLEIKFLGYVGAKDVRQRPSYQVGHSENLDITA